MYSIVNPVIVWHAWHGMAGCIVYCIVGKSDGSE